MKYFNSKVLLTLLIALVMVFSISACAAGDADSDDAGTVATEAPAATDAPAATEAPSATEAPAGEIVPAFTFTNTGAEEICEIYLSPTGQDAWGADQLGGKTIPAGEKYVLTNIPAGLYDLKAVGCAGSEVTGQLDIHN